MVLFAVAVTFAVLFAVAVTFAVLFAVAFAVAFAACSSHVQPSTLNRKPELRT